LSELFVASTHTPVLFFTNIGKVYKLKVWRLPLGTPQSRGKALINILPLEQGEVVTTLLPLPEDESTWGNLDAMFATASGNVRRNDLSDFTNVMSNGKIAMKLDEGDKLIGVAACDAETDDVLLATKGGKCIRFAATEIRRFKGRSSDGVRGITLAEGDVVINMSILKHVELDTEERDAYIRHSNALRRGETTAPAPEGMSAERFAELQAKEQLLLSVTANGYGKRTSAYEYRVTGRGGSGIINIETSDRNGHVVATFPVKDHHDVMMVTDMGRLIRVPVDDIRITGRQTQGVTLLRVDEGEHVASVARVEEGEQDEEDAVEAHE
jgi:DNA gyrase subunit A